MATGSVHSTGRDTGLTLRDLVDWVSSLQKLGVSPDSVIKGQIKLGGSLKQLSVTQEAPKSLSQIAQLTTRGQWPLA